MAKALFTRKICDSQGLTSKCTFQNNCFSKMTNDHYQSKSTSVTQSQMNRNLQQHIMSCNWQAFQSILYKYPDTCIYLLLSNMLCSIVSDGFIQYLNAFTITDIHHVCGKYLQKLIIFGLNELNKLELTNCSLKISTTKTAVCIAWWECESHKESINHFVLFPRFESWYFVQNWQLYNYWNLLIVT